MKTYLAIFLSKITSFCYAIVFCQQLINAQNGSTGDFYSIKIDKSDPAKAYVKCTLTAQDSLLYMSPIGANQFSSRWGQFVHNIKAETLEGSSIPLDTLQGAQWKININQGMPVRLTYEVHLDHENYSWSGGIDGVAYRRDWGVFYTGRSIFIMSGEQKKHIKVHFDIPTQWRVSTPWEPTGSDGTKFLVNNQTELSEGMFFAGTHEEYVVKSDEFELVFAFGGTEIIDQKDSFKNMAAGILEFYTDLMGGVPNPSTDNQFSRSIVVMNSSSQTDGEVIGNNISILIEKDGDAMSQLVARFIFAHEFFHLWNGKSFAPENDDCEWFREGFTNYYTLKSLYHIGYLDEASFLQVLNNFFYQRYYNDKGVGQLSMTQGDQKHDHWGLIYSGGLFTGISFDMMIRSASDNKKSVDNVMRTLFNKYGGTDQGYSLEELNMLMSEESGSDQTQFFDTFIKGSERIPVERYLNMGGFNAKESGGQLSISIKENLSPVEKQMNEGFFEK